MQYLPPDFDAYTISRKGMNIVSTPGHELVRMGSCE